MSSQTDIHTLMTELGRKARAAAHVLALVPGPAKDAALRAAAAAIRAHAGAIRDANAKDMAAGEAKGLTKALLDRLMLNDARIESMAAGLEVIAELPDPVGRVLAEWDRPNGLKIQRVAVPLGVIGIIYESRPNVTADAAGLCLKSGNAAILRGGSESFHSSQAIMAALLQGIRTAGLPEDAVQMIPVTDRAAVGEMLTMTEYIDVIVPRGGKSLVARVNAESRIPLFQHLEGICHTYVDGAADPAMARKLVLNAKMRRIGVCGATETLLVDRKAEAQLPLLVRDLLDAGCEVRGDDAAQAVDGRVVPATDEDWRTEYLDAIISVKLVDGVQAAIDHINAHGSHHTEAIVTEDAAAAETFLNGCDSAIVCWNASTQFADGGEFGMGAEIGISTGRMHARGPVGVEQLCTFKYKVLGSGQTRPG
ncbi:MAG: glutamate-5-semialdehyde dehydrogenase [Magnetospirillum sp.]|nr:glutamate-5-semialdehyde dehydrogenase [Magnetospirillum sp.]